MPVIPTTAHTGLQVSRHRSRRRALIVGMDYKGSRDWSELSGTFDAIAFNQHLQRAPPS
jgi:hypothetical protein